VEAGSQASSDNQRQLPELKAQAQGKWQKPDRRRKPKVNGKSRTEGASPR